ncbi:MAG: rhodanese-like domain-containing protein [Ignavibacteria bacterium]|nr:rhodanese-like domain-containing protein [Ignavibacteria bacterium]
MFNLRYLRNIFAVFILAIFVWSCSESSNEPTVNEAEVLIKYLESTQSPYGKFYVNTDLPSIVDAATLKADVEANKAYVIDIRAAADFAKGRIKGAKNISETEVINHIKSIDATKYDKIVIVCYTGQTAGYYASLARLLGYKNVFSLKWGMCSWHTDFAKRWRDVIANGNKYASQFETKPNSKGQPGNLPVLNTGKKTGKEILEARVNKIISEKFDAAKITADEVFQDLSKYYIVNYWPESQYLDPGHIPGAVQYTPKASLALDQELKTLPTNKTIVIYCYSGQTSAFLVAYLRLIGYDAKSLLFGANGMIYDKMVEKKLTTFNDNEIKNFEYEK